ADRLTLRNNITDAEQRNFQIHQKRIHCNGFCRYFTITYAKFVDRSLPSQNGTTCEASLCIIYEQRMNWQE
ncbi:hypothetical protein, partial [Staphylococcus aureus]|uniref:hypothetical protein n=1 Tax=Staphylococcus aureus TaxID=1280 RepID=UPI0038B36351